MRAEEKRCYRRDGVRRNPEFQKERRSSATLPKGFYIIALQAAGLKVDAHSTSNNTKVTNHGEIFWGMRTRTHDIG
jgi:hypothetical protein